MLKSFAEQAAYGLPMERRIAETAMTLLFPDRDDLTLFRLPERAHADFLVMTPTKILCAIEVKRRAVRSDTYPTTILPQTVADFAAKMERVGFPTYAAILFTDGLCIFDVLHTPSKARYLRNRQGRLRKHREYKVRKVIHANVA